MKDSLPLFWGLGDDALFSCCCGGLLIRLLGSRGLKFEFDQLFEVFVEGCDEAGCWYGKLFWLGLKLGLLGN